MKTAISSEELERLARRRAGRKMGWYIHALVYIAVNTGLALLSTYTGHHWALFPALGWGLGLLIHGFIVFVAEPGGNFQERLVQQEREKLRRQHEQQR